MHNEIIISWLTLKPGGSVNVVQDAEVVAPAAEIVGSARLPAIDALREGMRLLAWSPCSCRKAGLGNARSRELIVPFGGTGYIVLFEIVDDLLVVGAVRHQREEEKTTNIEASPCMPVSRTRCPGPAIRSMLAS
jgi:hypothetical protein